MLLITCGLCIWNNCFHARPCLYIYSNIIAWEKLILIHIFEEIKSYMYRCRRVKHLHVHVVRIPTPGSLFFLGGGWHSALLKYTLRHVECSAIPTHMVELILIQRLADWLHINYRVYVTLTSQISYSTEHVYIQTWYIASVFLYSVVDLSASLNFE